MYCWLFVDLPSNSCNYGYCHWSNRKSYNLNDNNYTSDEKNFSYNEPYQGKRVRKVKTTKESACTKACKLEGNKPGCVASFYTNQKVCFFAGSSGGETAAAHKGNWICGSLNNLKYPLESMLLSAFLYFVNLQNIWM